MRAALSFHRRPARQRPAFAAALPVVLLALGLASSPARAQHASDDPVKAADDAFGLTLGLESVGLYGPGGIRGFNPQTAGDVRINGLYFDQQGGLSSRVVEGSTVRVGVSAIGYAFPAPTGIVDYDLRHAGDGKPSASVVVSEGSFEGRSVSVDGNLPVISRELQLPIGAGYQVSTGTGFGPQPGYTSTVVSAGATPSWTPTERVTFRGILDWQQTTQARTLPTYFTAGDYLPPHITRDYLGQDWAEGRSGSQNYGATMNASLTRHWSLAAGVFRSIADNPVSFSDLYVNIQPSGAAEHLVVGNPDQRVASTSGEIRLTGHFSAGAWRHELVFLARGRDTLASYGGGDVVDVGPAVIGQSVQVPEPAFSYSARTRDHGELWSGGLAYRTQWNGYADLAVGLQEESYAKTVTTPGLGEAHLKDTPLRVYGTSAVALSKRVTAYAGYTQGLEDSGTAPNTAANRGAILPAARTWQADTGVRVLLTPKLKLIAGVFQIQKPYFNFDTSNVDRELGVQRAKGLELSLSGELAPRLDVTAGALLGKVTISGPDLSTEGVGPIAFGQPRTTYVITADYRFARWPSFSTDVTVFRFGAAPASIDNRVYSDPAKQLNLGGRYRFSMLSKPTTLRVQVQNVTNYYFWNIAYSPGFLQSSPRSVFGYLTADL